MSPLDKCPFCSEPKVITDKEGDIGYRCGSWASMQRGSFRSHGCKDAERARLAARVAELEARCKRLEEAGDAMANWNMNLRNLGCDPELAHKWQQAKEAKQ